MTLGIAAAAAVLGGVERRVATWCRRHGRSKVLAAQLRRNGCRNFREAENRTAIDLAIEAGRALLQRHPPATETSDLVLHVHTQLTSIAPPPAQSAQILTAALGLGDRDAVTLYQANCVSFLAAMRVAWSLMRTRPALRGILIVGADRQYSDSLRAMGNAAMTSDAGVAALLTRDNAATEILSLDVGTDGRFPRGVMFDEEHDFDDRYNDLTRRTIARALEKAGLSTTDVDHVFPHNINMSGWLRNLATLGIDAERLHMDGFSGIGHAFVCDTICNLIEGYPDRPDGCIALLHANGASGWSGAAVLRLNAPLPRITVDLPEADCPAKEEDPHANAI